MFTAGAIGDDLCSVLLLRLDGTPGTDLRLWAFMKTVVDQTVVQRLFKAQVSQLLLTFLANPLAKKENPP